MALRFFNTLTRRLEDFQPRQPGRVGLYTCGPTVYNFAHLGNFRTYVFEDVLRRALQFHGYAVTQVMNLTDVDDKTIRDSRAAGLSLAAFTQQYKDAFFADLKTLRIAPAEVYPAATAHIPEMLALIATLLAKGCAYVSDDGSVYFAIRQFPAYGQLARIDLAGQRAGVRIAADEYDKEQAADFALWKRWDAADGDVAWDSPWGRGRPGWNVECSAMSMKYLGPHFDIHTGGVDNMFPHHEGEIAQSEAANGVKFVNYWLHSEHLMVNHAKMSKSAGNFFTLRDLVAHGYSGREIRWLLLSVHYRQKLNFTYHAGPDGRPAGFTGLEAARVALRRLDDFGQRLRESQALPAAAADPAPGLAAAASTAFRAALADDLNVAGALAVLFDLVRDVNRGVDAGAVGGPGVAAVQATLAEFDRVLAVLDPGPATAALPAAVQQLVAERQAARDRRDYRRADEVRQQLQQLGWQVKDTPAGPKPLPL